MNTEHPILRYPGGKYRKFAWVAGSFPHHSTFACYCEPFGGGASVLLNLEKEARVEVYNDLDEQVSNFFATLRHPRLREQLIEQVTLTPWSRKDWEISDTPTDDPVESARRLLIKTWMSYAPFLNERGSFRAGFGRERGLSDAKIWRKMPRLIAETAQRLRGVVVECADFEKVIKRYDSHRTLFYVDPPYKMETRDKRSRGKARQYRHDSTPELHTRLAEVLTDAKGMVILSGYLSDQYKKLYADWYTISSDSGTANGGTRKEVLWINPRAMTAKGVTSLFQTPEA